MFVEIRNYHYDPEKFDAYREWARELAVPFLKNNLDLVGFWLDNGEDPEIAGRDPMTLKHGSANVTWIIRWESMTHRTEGHRLVFQSEGWREIWSKHPDPGGYLQLEARFASPV